MKDTFHGWAHMGDYKLDTVVDYILTGRKAIEAKPDEWLMTYIGNPTQKLDVLDFGCGVGRNTFGMAVKHPNWWVSGYDNAGMLSKKEEFFTLHYTSPYPLNAIFTSDWEAVKLHKFDVIVCSLVLQHIYEDALNVYLKDFKTITKKLVVSGRRVNDDPKGRSNWTILQEHGWVPTEFFHNGKAVPFLPEGSLEEHNTAVYVNPIVFS